MTIQKRALRAYNRYALLSAVYSIIAIMLSCSIMLASWWVLGWYGVAATVLFLVLIPISAFRFVVKHKHKYMPKNRTLDPEEKRRFARVLGTLTPPFPHKQISWHVVQSKVQNMLTFFDPKESHCYIIVTEPFLSEMNDAHFAASVGHELGHVHYPGKVLSDYVRACIKFYQILVRKIHSECFVRNFFSHTLSVLLLPFEFLGVMIARSCEHGADAYAIACGVSPKALCSLLVQLKESSQRRGCKESNPFMRRYGALLHSHPSISKRIACIRSLE